MTKNYTYSAKSNGQTLTAEEWNNLAQDVDALVTGVNNGTIGGASNSGTPVAIDTSGVISVNSKGNTTLSATKHVNIEPAYVQDGGEGTYGDVQIKPGDDITLESHHRSSDKRDEITIKTSNGQDGANKAPVKLQVIASDVTLSSKGKKEDSNVMNVNVTTGSGKGYLKVRAQAIDLRCEEHGGVAILPKGLDSQNHMNKIKFEHGGGDGLEFGTFNTEKTSIFTDEYRFNKDGVWKMATRVKEVSDKYDNEDETTHYKYTKQADDFYDVITPYDSNTDTGDVQCTTKDIIKTANAMNGGKDRHTKITKKGALEIATNPTYLLSMYVPGPVYYDGQASGDEPENNTQEEYTNISTISTKLASFESIAQNGLVFNDGDFDVLPTDGVVYTNGTENFTFTEIAAPSIKIESGGELKLGGILDFGSSFNFGETDNGIEFQYKLTKKNATKDCGVLKVVGVNNHQSNSLIVEGVTIAPGNTGTIAQCSVLDIIKLVNYMKTNNQGPWQV